jgi:cytochrome c5
VVNAVVSSANAAGSGEATYNATCVACHGAGIAGAPKTGDKAAWAARIAKGNDAMYSNAIKGFSGKGGVMPPKGGNTALKDADVKAAVDFMVSKSQ